MNVIATIALLASVTVGGLTVHRSSLFGFTIGSRTVDADEAAVIVEAAAKREEPSLGCKVALLVNRFRKYGRVAVSADLKTKGHERIIIEAVPFGARTEREIQDFGNDVSRAMVAASGPKPHWRVATALPRSPRGWRSAGCVSRGRSFWWTTTE